MTIRPNPTTHSLFNTHNPWLMLLITLGVAMVSFQFIGSFFGILFAFVFYPGNMEQFYQALLNPTIDENMRTPFLIMQGAAAFTGFIIMPWLLLKFYYKGQIADLSSSTTKSPLVVITIFIALFFMGINAPFIEWNQNLVFPEALAGLEEKLKALEDTLAKTSKFITNFDNVGQLFLGLVVVAILPGIGEEFVFRGLIQNHVYGISKNIHVAIWVSALLFSLFHMQFYGVVPRMILGAMFGYLYYFSGNIIYPMIAHFFNNGFTLVMLYLFKQNMVEYNIEDTEVLPWFQVIFSAGITLVLFFAFQKIANRNLTDE
jgi:membrane protease YdiL (CAAX protease family)